MGVGGVKPEGVNWESRIITLGPDVEKHTGQSPGSANRGNYSLAVNNDHFTRKRIPGMTGMKRRNSFRITTEPEGPPMSVAHKVRRFMMDLDPKNSDQVRAWAASQLGFIGPKAIKAGGRLLKIFADRSESPRLRHSAAYALGRVVYKKAFSALRRALEDHSESFNVRGAAIRALNMLRISDKKLIRILIKIFRRILKKEKSREADVHLMRMRAARGLKQFGPMSRAAAHELESVVRNRKHENYLLTREAVLALGAIGDAPPDRIRLLIDTLQTGDAASVREAAATALGMIGDKGGMVVVHALGKVFVEGGGRERQKAAQALAGFKGAKARSAIREMVKKVAEKGLKDSSSSVRLWTIWLLSYMGPAARPAVGMLKKIAAGDPAPGVKKSAAETLREILGK